MKESSWFECVDNSICIKVSADPLRARSLIETAKARLNHTKKSRIDEENANFIFEDYYSSALEMLHALLFLNGFKADNHICSGFFLRDMLKRIDLFRIFDDARQKRNNLVYYGKKTDFETAKEQISRLGKFINELDIIIRKFI
ncbi:MAG: hypothetical protein V1866_05825 [archaeon]